MHSNNAPILAQGLLAVGFVRSFPRAIVHGPWQWGGLNILNLFTEQAIAHVHMILKFGGQKDNITGCLLQVTWEALILKAGLVGNSANFPDTIQDYITRTWVSEMWGACHQANIQIIGDQPQLEPQRERDTEIMRLFIQQGYRKNELEVLNQCRMYIHAIFLSDICTATGDALEQSMWQQPAPITSKYEWPMTPQLTPGEWNTWQRALQQTLSLGKQLSLSLPLGRWIHDRATKHQWFHGPAKEAVY